MDEGLNLQYIWTKLGRCYLKCFQELKSEFLSGKNHLILLPTISSMEYVFPQASSYALLVITRSKLLSNYSEKQAP